ncbi:hypothetical protein B0H11DRAFT_1902297 [Mycena galericulata]|nr:hypothetical protein B0H11DRAFT_1902297 [Mycena galericulata]
MLITAHLVLTTLLTTVSCAASNIVQYVTFSLLVSYSAMLLARPFVPSARMKELEQRILETTDLLQRATEERVLPNRAFNLEMQLRLSRGQFSVNLDKSMLSSKVLGFRLGHPTREYLHIIGVLSQEIRRCKTEAKEIQVAILTEMEHERQLVYNDDINDKIMILSSEFPRKTGRSGLNSDVQSSRRYAKGSEKKPNVPGSVQLIVVSWREPNGFEKLTLDRCNMLMNVCSRILSSSNAKLKGSVSNLEPTGHTDIFHEV